MMTLAAIAGVALFVIGIAYQVVLMLRARKLARAVHYCDNCGRNMPSMRKRVYFCGCGITWCKAKLAGKTWWVRGAKK